MNDEELMRQYQAGDEEAFVKLYDKYASLIYSYIARRLKHDDAEDFYQQVWRRLHEKRALYNGQPFISWFFTLIKNLLIDEYRAIGSRRSMLERYRLESLEADLAGESDLDELLKVLPSESATLVREYFLEAKTYEELSMNYGTSEATIRQRLSRSLKTMRLKIRGAE